MERFATESGRARLQAVEPPPSAPSGLRLSTRRTGLAPEEVLLSPDDAAERSLVEGGKVWLVTSSGRLGAVVRLAAVASGSIQAHWPRARALVGSDSCTAPVVVIEPR